MNNYFITSILFLICTALDAQTLNAILFVNEKVIDEEITNLQLNITNESGIQKLQMNYYPGELIFGDENWAKIVAKDTKKISISFDFNQFGKNDKHTITQFEIPLENKHLDRPYLMIHIYDFRNRKYKKWYKHLTNEDYLTENIYPNSGIYIRK